MAEEPEGLDEAAEVLRSIMAEVGERPCPIEGAQADAWLDDAAAIIEDLPQLGVSGWLCAVAALTLWGPRTQADADSLAAVVAESEGADPADLAGLLSSVESRWQALGALDDQQRLSALGWWGLPEALLRAWSVRR